MTSHAFMKFSTYILSPRDTGYMTPEAMGTFAARHLSSDERLAAAAFLESQLVGTDQALRRMWVGSNSRVGPGEDSARSFTKKMIAVLRDPTGHT